MAVGAYVAAAVPPNHENMDMWTKTFRSTDLAYEVRTCVDCAESFVLTANERQFYLKTFRDQAKAGRDPLPRRCKRCRQARKLAFAVKVQAAR